MRLRRGKKQGVNISFIDKASSIKILLIFLILVSMSCSSDSRLSSNGKDEVAPISNSDHDTSLALKRNKNLWKSKKIENYNLTFGTIRFDGTPVPVPKQVIVEVRNGQAISTKEVRDADNGPAAPAWVIDLYKRYDTVEKLFDVVEESLGNSHKLEVDYDETYGYPSSFEIDSVSNLHDDERSLKVIKFEVVK